jgi:cation diffusion facilitator family transporter
VLLRIAKAHRSEALKASGHHLMSDVITSLGAIIGLGLVYVTGLQWFDPVVAIIIALQLGYTGYGIVRKSLGALIDEVDVKVIEEFAKSLRAAGVSEAIDVHHVRFIRAGYFHHVDAHVVLPEFWTVEKSHRVTLEMEQKVRAAYPYDLEIAFHVDPCERNYCSACSVKDCQIRREAFVAARVWTAEQLTQGPAEEI